MNILFLAPRMPLPADTGGKIRTFNMLKQLALRNHVHLLCFSFEPGDKGLAPKLRALGIDVTLVPAEEPGGLLKLRNAFFTSLPLSVAKYRTMSMLKAIKTLLKTQLFDAVHMDHAHMSQYRPMFTGLPCFMDEHNVEHLILQRCADVEGFLLKKLLYALQASKMKNFEAGQAPHFSGIFACSADDQQVLRRMSGDHVPVQVIANGVDTAYFDPQTPGESEGELEESLVFTGSMDWLPNEDAVTHFCTQVLPRVRAQKPGVKLYIVGKSPSPAVQRLAGPLTVVTGLVDDVRPFIQRARVFVAPLRIGGGTRLKILEAMSMAKPVVSTTIGAEGIECTPDEDIVLADTPEAMAQAVVSLLNDPGKAMAVGTKARALVREKYDWAIVGEKLNSIYQEAASHES